MHKFLKRCKVYFAYAILFSFFANILMLSLPIYMMQVFDRVISSRSVETLVMLSIMALTCLFAHMLLELFRSRLLSGAGLALDGMAGPSVITGVLNVGARPGSNPAVSSLRDVSLVRTFLTGHAVFAVFDAPWVPIYLGVIFMFHGTLGVIATLGAIGLFTLAYMNEKLTRAPLEEMQKDTRRAGRYIDSGLRNAEVAGALGMVPALIARWQHLNDRVIDSQARADRMGGVLRGITRFIRLSLQILMLGVGGWLVIRQNLSPGVMMAGTLILSRALAPVESAIQTWKSFVEARGAYQRLNELLTPAKLEAEAATPLPAPTGRVDADRVTFAIPGQDRLIIKGVGLSLTPGEALGLIGPSAAGKSTLARLLTGVWRPASGTVRLDGADVSRWPREQLGPQIGYVPQDVELFLGTVGENIARLRQNADPEAIIEAAQRAHAHDMIVRLPKAYDTEVGEAGAELSAGQRQRVALARALFGRPRFIVLDEPNSNLDAEGEEALAQTLRDLKREGVTVITISHRPSLLAHVDRLMVLRDGQVEMFGPRAEVVARLNARGPGADAPPVSIAGRKN
ncbi:MAG: type I secretion system permease/ATPase [Gammaproteobacteria bacterium]|nr:type I secretion system permease/ATPase [Gammaproteobacteria bacterium]